MRHCPQGRVHTGHRLRALGSVPLARPGPGRTPPRDVCLAPGPLRALPTAATPAGAGAPHSSLEPLLRPACQNAPAHQANPSLLYSEGAGRFPTCLGWGRFWPLGEEQRNKAKQPPRADPSMVNRGFQRQHQKKDGVRGHEEAERLEPTSFLVGCGFSMGLAPQQDRIRDSHINTP